MSSALKMQLQFGFDSPAEQIGLFHEHRENNVYATFASKGGGIWRETNMQIGNLALQSQRAFEGRPTALPGWWDKQYQDVYFSQNAFSRPRRGLGNIAWLNTLFVDIDLYKTGQTQAELLRLLKGEYFGRRIPYPTHIESSGRGLYLKWKHASVPGSRLADWQIAEDWLVSQLLSVGADPQVNDATRVLRLAGSMNSKSGTQVRLLEAWPHLYDLNEIAQEAILALPKPREQTVSRLTKLTAVHGQQPHHGHEPEYQY